MTPATKLPSSMVRQYTPGTELTLSIERDRPCDGQHWAITQADPQTSKVVFQSGGTYTLDGDTYTETIEYASESTAEYIKKTFKFKIKVEGDTYTQVGAGDDNPFSEVWKRAK